MYCLFSFFQFRQFLVRFSFLTSALGSFMTITVTDNVQGGPKVMCQRFELIFKVLNYFNTTNTTNLLSR